MLFLYAKGILAVDEALGERKFQFTAVLQQQTVHMERAYQRLLRIVESGETDPAPKQNSSSRNSRLIIQSGPKTIRLLCSVITQP